MKTHVVLSASGRDRVGVADDLSAMLDERSIRIEESKWAAVGGRFSVMVQICGDEEVFAELRGDLSALRDELGFDLRLEPVEKPRPETGEPQYVIECFASGPPDMNAITALFKRLQVNIDALETEAAGRLYDSSLPFTMTARVSIPPSSLLDELRDALRRLAHERNMDIVIRPVRERVIAPDLASVDH